jgi:hypothetical protein
MDDTLGYTLNAVFVVFIAYMLGRFLFPRQLAQHFQKIADTEARK